MLPTVAAPRINRLNGIETPIQKRNKKGGQTTASLNQPELLGCFTACIQT
jgi:hypothetical protein